MSRIGIFLVPIYLVIPAVVLYFVIKLAVKHVIKELKDDGVL